MDWSSIKEEKIDYPSESDAGRLSVLNDGNPVPKNWHSAFAYALGIEYKVNDILRLRTGYLFHKTPIPQANFDTSLPDSSSNTVTLGAGIDLNKNIRLDLAYAAMFYDERKIDNNVGSASGASIDGEYNTLINVYLLTLTFKI
jgi:long-subunit fatty acid transport protein